MGALMLPKSCEMCNSQYYMEANDEDYLVTFEVLASQGGNDPKLQYGKVFHLCPVCWQELKDRITSRKNRILL